MHPHMLRCGPAGWPRSAATALALAELHLDAALSLQDSSHASSQAAQPGASQAAPAPAAGDVAPASRAAPGPSGGAPAPDVQGSKKRRGGEKGNGKSKAPAGKHGTRAAVKASATPFERHLAAAEANIGLCTAAALTALAGDSSGGSGPLQQETVEASEGAESMDAEGPGVECGSAADVVRGSGGGEPALHQRQQQLRWLWLQGRLADARKRPNDAVAALNDCRSLLLSAQPAAARVAEGGGADADASGEGQLGRAAADAAAAAAAVAAIPQARQCGHRTFKCLLANVVIGLSSACLLRPQANLRVCNR